MEELNSAANVRRLSQAIAEGDGISIIVRVDGAARARSAESQGAEALVVTGAVEDMRGATALPVLWRDDAAPEAAAAAGAHAWALVVAEGDEEDLARGHDRSLALGLEPVVEVRNEDELAAALELLDPEIFLLSARDLDADEDALDHVLGLLPDVPAGKLAVADVAVRTRDEVLALERAGVDGVIVESGDVSHLVGDASPDV